MVWGGGYRAAARWHAASAQSSELRGDSAAPSGCQGHRTVSAGRAWQLRIQELRTQQCSQGSSWVSGLLVDVRRRLLPLILGLLPLLLLLVMLRHSLWQWQWWRWRWGLWPLVLRLLLPVLLLLKLPGLLVQLLLLLLLLLMLLWQGDGHCCS